MIEAIDHRTKLYALYHRYCVILTHVDQKLRLVEVNAATGLAYEVYLWYCGALGKILINNHIQKSNHNRTIK